MSKCCYCSFGWASLIIGLLLLIAGLVVQLAVMPPIYIDSMNDVKVLGLNPDGTPNDFTAAWVTPAYIANTEFYVFDYANTGGIMNRGSYPDMDEKGPYSYKTAITNEVVSWGSDGETVNYYQRFVYYFDPDQSCKGCDPKVDKVKIPDIIYQLIVNVLPTKKICKKPEKGSLDEKICNMVNDDLLDNIEKGGILFSLLNIEPFVYVTVDQLLFSGYTTPIVESLKEADLFAFTFLNDQPEIQETLQNITEALGSIPINYIQNNNTLDFYYTALTGKSDPAKTGFVTGFTGTTDYPSSEDGKLPLKWWDAKTDDRFCPTRYADKARTIDGTIGDFFQSFITKDSELPIYISDICRTVTLTYGSDVNVKGIDGYRFTFGDDVFNSLEPDNCGYCKVLPRDFHSYPEGYRCLPSGYLDLSGCMSIPIPDYGDLALPIVASLPHFYQTDGDTKFAPRFKPNIDDAPTLDIEPFSGTLLKAQKKMQINMYIGQSRHTAFNSLKVQRSGAYPLFYLNQTALIDQNDVNILSSTTNAMNSTIPIICWSAVGVGAALIVISIIFFCCSCSGKKDKKDD
ncbi:scav-1 [Pristionchus pacificus]|uniref:Scav-1 n=1 Tax=Pristionchus pacificus TaxID=54126 RepID=A0A454XQH3_PRIPA|nr:scav-1 [Pristionchus pacificus]|eukprot:PDM64551.1 scav-1 [Pristionchus pacificus]